MNCELERERQRETIKKNYEGFQRIKFLYIRVGGRGSGFVTRFKTMTVKKTRNIPTFCLRWFLDVTQWKNKTWFSKQIIIIIMSNVSCYYNTPNERFSHMCKLNIIVIRTKNFIFLCVFTSWKKIHFKDSNKNFYIPNIKITWYMLIL